MNTSTAPFIGTRIKTLPWADNVDKIRQELTSSKVSSCLFFTFKNQLPVSSLGTKMVTCRGKT